MSDQFQQYDEIARRYEAAITAFNRTYIVRVPPPERAEVKGESIFVMVALALMVVASVIVSGSRTIVAFGGGVIGVAGFIMIECAIVAYAFIHTRTDYDAERHNSVKNRIKQGMWLAFFVGVSANIYAELKNNGVELSSFVDGAILVVLGLSAPVLAFIDGDVLGMYAVRGEQRQRKADEEYALALSKWHEGRMASWDREKGKWGIKVDVSAPRLDVQTDMPALSMSVQTDRQTDNRQTAHSGFGHNRTPDGQKRVIEYLTANPQDVALNLRDLGTAAGVNKDTASAGKKAWIALRRQQEQQAVSGELPEAKIEYVASTNGNGNGAHHDDE